MSPASWTAVAALSAAGLFAAQLTPTADAHVYLMNPVSRNLWGTSAFQEPGSPEINFCPHCFQSRGPAAIRERGGGAPWPHFNGERAANGNYIESEEVAQRHGICGDPEQTAAEGSNLYGRENSNYPVLETYAEGGILEAKIVVSTYHWGHIEMFLCDSADLPDGEGGTVTQACFNQYPLDRAEDDEFNAPIDPENRGRFILDPPCRASETDQELLPGAFPGDVATARFQLPQGVTCQRCIVQMVYYTGNSCQHQGYAEFNPPSWPSSCAPSKADWINEAVGQCGDGDAYPEEFWNCADIAITSDGGPGPSPSVPAPTPAEDEPEPMPTPEPMPVEPMPVPTPTPTYSPETMTVPTPTPTYSPEMPEPTFAPESESEDEAEPSPAPTTIEQEEEFEEEEEESGEPTPSPVGDEPEPATPFDEPEPATPFDEPNTPPEATFAPSALPPVSPADDCEDPVGDYNQCGGTDYEGSTCCRIGFECDAVTDCYSECRPSADRCSDGWAQCGGLEWDGPTCCWDGAVCLERNEWYSQCVPEEYA